MDEIRSDDHKIKTENVKSDSCSQKLRKYFAEYCKDSSIHGIKYIGEQNRTLIEKFWWLTAITFALYYCIILMKAKSDPGIFNYTDYLYKKRRGQSMSKEE
ncbi:ASC domain containing protein [Asbolus verrucosus]|uniref:ASC domain containing protein n=1 Tax=Asbolus verrucosus TaxID=1661398 RepID=A0A482VVK7_ASBVE|nr:ASC domain containing protein [Asbolus verrucosus]